MESIEEQTSRPTRPRPRVRIKKAWLVTLAALGAGIFLLPWWWWFTITVACLIVHLLLTIGHWYEIAELIWEENLDLTAERDVAVRKAEQLEDELAAYRRKSLKVVDVPVLRSGEIPTQRRGES